MKLYFDNNRLWLYAYTFCITILVFSVVGAIYNRYLDTIVYMLVTYTTHGIVKPTVMGIFLNNVVAMSLLMGFFTFRSGNKFSNMFAFIYLIYIGAVTGFVVAGATIRIGGSLVILSLLPHGVIELPIIFISMAAGWKLFEIPNWKNRVTPYLTSFLILAMFLFISAIIEVHVSGNARNVLQLIIKTI